jgi:bisphosphoglycerate-dependent phosphoglycerate mutase
MLALLLAQGKKFIGFCDCDLCNQGSRQILARLAKSKDGEAGKLTAESRDVILRARNTEITVLSFDISKALPKEKKNEGVCHEGSADALGKKSPVNSQSR